MPSSENISKEDCDIDITEFNFSITPEKEISALRVFFPISWIEDEKRKLINMVYIIIKNIWEWIQKVNYISHLKK